MPATAFTGADNAKLWSLGLWDGERQGLWLWDGGCEGLGLWDGGRQGLGLWGGGRQGLGPVADRSRARGVKPQVRPQANLPRP